MRPLLIIILSSIFTINLFGQELILVKVIDSQKKSAIEGASVTLHSGNDKKLIDFGITNKNGIASLNPKGASKELRIKASILGYASKELVYTSSPFTVTLEAETIHLNDVVVKGSRIWNSGDTLRYNASSFISEKDQNLEDLLRRMPGIEVGESGQISYNGKSIGKIKIEGADMMGSNYKTLSKSIPAKAIQQVQVINNDQEIAVLKNFVSSEVTNLNLKLKQDFKNRWVTRTNMIVGTDSKRWLYQPTVSPMLIARKTQSLFHLGASNLGRGLHQVFRSYSLDLQDIPDAKLLNIPSVSPPIKESRSLFDNTYTFSGNKLYNLSAEKQLKVNGSLQTNRLNEEYSKGTIYYLPDDTLYISEEFQNKTKQESFEVSFDLKNNTPKSFFRNNLTFKGANIRGIADIQAIQPVKQQIGDEYLSVCNNSRLTFLINNRPVTWNTVIGYQHRNEYLRFSKENNKYKSNSFYGYTEFAHHFSLKNIVINNLFSLTFDENRYRPTQSLRVSSNLKWVLNDLEVYLSAAPKFSILNNEISFLPKVYWKAQYSFNFDWKITLMNSYSKNLGSPILNFRTPYQTTYRTWRFNNEGTPINSNFLNLLKIEYANPLTEWFGYIEGSYIQNRFNYMFQQEISENKVYNTLVYKGDKNISKNLSARLAKTFFDTSLMLSVDVHYTDSKRSQLYLNKLQPLQFKSLTFNPKISWSSSLFNLDYQTNCNFRKNNFSSLIKTQSLLDINQFLNIGVKLNDFEISTSYEWFKMDVGENQSITSNFFDFALSYYSALGLFKLEINNLFDVNQFGYTITQNASSYYYRYKIRPREFLLSFNLKL